jgi:hypothetical protein
MVDQLTIELCKARKELTSARAAIAELDGRHDNLVAAQMAAEQRVAGEQGRSERQVQELQLRMQQVRRPACWAGSASAQGGGMHGRGAEQPCSMRVLARGGGPTRSPVLRLSPSWQLCCP